MKTSITIHYPNKLDIIFDKLNKFGIKVILIGGYVRDSLLNISSKDIDIELYNVKSFDFLEKLLEEFGDVNSVGKSFGVCKLSYKGLDLDFSLPRKDSKHSKGHKGFEITLESQLDFKSAASRRDFTINSIGYDVQERKILDPFKGLDDLKNSLLKAVDLQKFGEDPLRVLRAIGFAARFNFRVDEALFKLSKEMIQKNILQELAKERILTELQKLLLKSAKPSIGLTLAKKLNINNYFGEYDSLEKIDYYASHNIGDEKIDFLIFLTLLYEKKSFKQIKKITNEVKLLKEIKNFLDTKEVFSLENLSHYELYKLATRVNIEIFSFYLSANFIGKKDKEIQELQKKAQLLGIMNKKIPPLIEGRDLLTLGLPPSKEFKIILKEAYTAQIQELFNSKDEALIWLQKYIKS